MSAKGLGKGFGSLLPENFDTSVMLDKGERVQKIAISSIEPDPNQPRKIFDEVAIKELAESIKRYGILQPLVVTQSSSGQSYIIIAGERRFRAAKLAGLTHVPALVRSIEEIERLEIGLIENMQRVDLNPIEQALSIARLHEQFNVSLQDIALRLGKAHTTVVNTVRLLQLPDFARKALEEGKISEGHARAVLALKDNHAAQKYLVDAIIRQSWSVRQAEQYVKDQKNSIKKPDKDIAKQAPQFTKEQGSLQKKYGGQVRLRTQKSGFKAEFTFKTNTEFIQFIDKITD